MKQKELTALLDFIQKQNSPEGDELVSIVLKMASDSAALKAVKDKPLSDGAGEKKILKFTKQEIEIMPAYLKQILLMYNGNAVTYRYHNGSYETRYTTYSEEYYFKEIEKIDYEF